MSSINTAAARRRSYTLAAAFFSPVLSVLIPTAQAQQSASPNLLPSIQVESPPEKNRTESAPSPDHSSDSHRAVPARQREPGDAKPSVTPGQAPPSVVSPATTGTHIGQTAQSVTGITAND